MTPKQIEAHRQRLISADVACRRQMQKLRDLDAADVTGARLQQQEDRTQRALDRFNDLEATYPGNYLGEGFREER